MIEKPNVFISYSHDNEEHKNWVLKLATNLVSHGVDVILDQWDLRLGNDLGFFMEQGLTNSHLVLCICSENYVMKSNGRSGGTGYESSIITQSLLSDANREHIICIVRNNTTTQKVPIPLGSKRYIDFTNDENYLVNYKELLERIYDRDKVKKPILGQNPFLNEKADEIFFAEEIKKLQYANIEYHGKITFNIKDNNGQFKIGSGEYEFTTVWSSRSSDSVYAYSDGVKKIGYLDSFTKIPSSDDLDKFDYSSRIRGLTIGEIAVLINDFNNFAVIKVVDIIENCLTFEYQIFENIIK